MSLGRFSEDLKNPSLPHIDELVHIKFASNSRYGTNILRLFKDNFKILHRKVFTIFFFDWENDNMIFHVFLSVKIFNYIIVHDIQYFM